MEKEEYQYKYNPNYYVSPKVSKIDYKRAAEVLNTVLDLTEYRKVNFVNTYKALGLYARSIAFLKCSGLVKKSPCMHIPAGYIRTKELTAEELVAIHKKAKEYDALRAKLRYDKQQVAKKAN